MTTRETRRTTGILVAMIAGVACAVPAMGQGGASPDGATTGKAASDAGSADVAKPDSLADWTIEVNPRLWWVSPSGKMQLPGSTAPQVRVETLDLDTPEFSPAGSVAINADRFRFSFFGSNYSRDANFVSGTAFQLGTLSVSGGDAVQSSFDLGIYELTVGYRFYQRDFKLASENKAECADVLVNLFVLGGVRLYDLGIHVSRPGVGSTGTDQFFGEPIAGIRSELEIVRDFTMNLQLDGGGYGDSDRTNYSFNISADFQWRPLAWLGVQIGWRQTLYSFTDGKNSSEFQYDGAMAGLFTGLVIRF